MRWSLDLELFSDGFGSFQDVGGPHLTGWSGQLGPEEHAMTDLPISHSHSVKSAEKIAPTFAQLFALFRTAYDALAQASARNAQRRATRRAPEEIMAAQARGEEARRTVDRLLLPR